MKLKQLKDIRDEERLMRLLYSSRHTPAKIFKEGNTLLHLAVYTKNLNSVKIVYEFLRTCNLHKKLIGEKNLKGESPRELAFRLRELDIFEWLSHPETGRKEIEEASDIKKTISNLEKSSLSVQSQVKFKDSILHHFPLRQRASASAISVMFLKAGIKLKTENILREYLNFPATWWNKFLTTLSLIGSVQSKEYPWKQVDFNKKHYRIHSTNINIAPSLIRKFQAPLPFPACLISLVCSLSDKILQEHFLSKVSVSHNLLLLPYSGAWKMYPLKIKANKNNEKKIKKTTNQIIKSLVNNQWLRVTWETKIFNWFYEKKQEWLKNILSGKKSRFALYHYQGHYEMEDNQNVEFSELIRPLPQFKISIGFYFKNDELFLSLDAHDQIVSGPSELRALGDKIKGEIEEYLHSNLAPKI